MSTFDFTYRLYHHLLVSLAGAGYEFHPVGEYIAPQGRRKSVFLRHDVDRGPERSLVVARIEAEAGAVATYYFRAKPCSWDEGIIREISALGHEIGYHYESLTTCGGDVDAAYGDFCRNLERLRQIVPVKTICMHGSPRSPFDSRDIWKKFDYHSLGVEVEPYLDIDWSKVFYLTDTGRRWDGFKVSVRDRIPVWQEEWCRQGLVFRSTDEIIRRVEVLPQAIMFTTHPQRWCERGLPWLQEYLLQSAKNVVKRALIPKVEY